MNTDMGTEGGSPVKAGHAIMRSMTVFGDYAAYYDLIYAEKNYAAECEFVTRLLSRYDPAIHSILELGCGTGRHAELLAQHGYQVLGVDRSRTMLSHAERRQQTIPAKVASLLRFVEADIRELRLEEKFDAAVALFHTMSYMIEGSDLRAALHSVRRHLRPGGLFLFDFWYGPAVLRTPPVVRIKRLQLDGRDILRIAEPTMHLNEDCVDVSYEMHVVDTGTSRSSVTRETHRVRYLFLPELRDLLTANGFELLLASHWLEERPPDSESWNTCVVARALAP